MNMRFLRVPLTCIVVLSINLGGIVGWVEGGGDVASLEVIARMVTNTTPPSFFICFTSLSFWLKTTSPLESG